MANERRIRDPKARSFDGPERASDHSGRAIVVGPYARSEQRGNGAAAIPARSPERRLEEAVGLAEAIGLEIAGRVLLSIPTFRPATLIGRGHVEDLKLLTTTEEADVVIFDAALSPTQQRNLERALNAKVLDRTGLILEIFGERAQTREGRLQVEFAHLTYQKSRLVRSWTHLERQRGGFGFLGGPGETQIEADRRMIEERLARISRDLEKVRRTRGLHRRQRQRTETPVVALVGYTNAGKSTLFNSLSGAAVYAKDLLFATLDPTARRIALPDDGEIVLSDTVGFISDLPTGLIAAFRATLEEVTQADLILHVRDIASPQCDAEAADVDRVLRELGIDPETDGRIVEVWNKIDLLEPEVLANLQNIAARKGEGSPVLVSAFKGGGLDSLLARIGEEVSEDRDTLHACLGMGDGAALAWLYENGKIISRDDRADGTIDVDVVLNQRDRALFADRFPHITIDTRVSDDHAATAADV